MINRVEPAPSSAETFGSTLSDDGSVSGGRNRNGDRRRRRKEKKKGNGRLGKEFQRMLTPVVKVLLFGVLLSLLDVFYIFKHLEEASEVEPTQETQLKLGSTGEKTDNNQSKNSEIKGEGYDPVIGREPILKLIRDAGIEFDPVKDINLIDELPLWSDVVDLYGAEPVIYGLNQGNCERFQAHSDKGDHLIGTAGTFNTGTNLLSELLIANCVMPERMKKHGSTSRGIRWQVPWGKHSPAGDKEYRESHKTAKDKAIDANEIMPMVTIRDPLIWLKSMCRHKYTARWVGFQDTEHCPNFLMKNLETIVKYDGFKRSYESILHLWNDYYNEYKNIDIPFLLVRFEDLVFHPVETVTQVCECGGGKIFRKNFKYIVNSAKKGAAAHGAMNLRTGFVDAIVKYASIDKRYKGFSKDDLEYVRDHIDQTTMDMMKYSSIDPSFNDKQESPI